MRPKFEMADITTKKVILREAVARGEIRLRASTVSLIKQGGIAKGDPLAAAEVAAVLAAKNTHQILPFCHPLPLTTVRTKAALTRDRLSVETRVKTRARTGVEMEALTSACAYLLTVWDMVKQYEKDAKGQYPQTEITSVRVKRKFKGT